MNDIRQTSHRCPAFGGRFVSAPILSLPANWPGKIDVSAGPRACWPWTGPLTPQGYGRTTVRLNGRWRAAGAHQVAHCLATGRWESQADRRLVRHLCNNRPCCNPAHLRGGTAAQNARDRALSADARRAVADTLATFCLLVPVAGVAR